MTSSMTSSTRRRPTAITSALSIERNPSVILTDPARKGLRLVPQAGRRVWVYRYRAADGRLRQMKLGEYPMMSWKLAGQEWQKHKVERDAPSGGDPVAVVRARKQKARRERDQQRAAAFTVQQLCDEYVRYLRDGGKKGRRDGVKRASEIERMLNHDVIAKLGNQQAAGIRRRQVQDLIDSIKRRAPRIAAMVLQALKAAYERAIVNEKLNCANPCSGVEAPPAVRRTRALDQSEVRQLYAWLPTARLSQSSRDLMELELLTAARQGEICGAPWSEVDLDNAIWTLPGSRTKNGLPHTIYLSRQAVALLRKRRETTRGSRWVFPRPNTDKPIGPHGIVWALALARDDCPVAHFTCHDLRRTALTGLARIKCPRVVQDRIANHVDGSISATYDRHTYDVEAKEWWQRWADELDGLRAHAGSSVESKAATSRPVGRAPGRRASAEERARGTQPRRRQAPSSAISPDHHI